MGFGKNNTGQIWKNYAAAVAVGALAGDTALIIGTKPAITEDARIMKTEIAAFCEGLATDDILLFGMCNGELTVTEIAEALNFNGPVSRDDRERNEFAFRNVRLLGMFNGEGAVITPLKGLNGQEGMITDQFPWTYGKTNGWNFFVFNPLTGDPIDTGALVSFRAKHYGVWVQ